mgnify:CR=1 FL=1
MKKDKGFTLIELLTVIAILAVILLIAAPTILGVLDKAKRSTFKNQVLMYVEGLKTQVALSEIGQEQNITWTNNETIVDFSSIDMDSANNYTGKIKVTRNNGKYTYTVIDAHGDGWKLDSQLKPEEIADSNIIVDDKKQVQEYTITNMIINGSFEDGLTGWTIEGDNNTNSIVSDVSLIGSNSFKRGITDKEATNYLSQQIDWIKDHKYYYFMYGYINSNGQQTLYADIFMKGYAIKMEADSNSFKRGSSIYTPTTTEKRGISFNWNANNVETFVDGLALIDLTETFGAGNEPTKEWCDKNIPYFDGTTKIYK